MIKRNPRRSNSTRRNKLRRQVAEMGAPCALCGKPIDYTLPAGDPMSYELDEILPVSKGGDPYDPANVQPAHRICNQRKGNGMNHTEGVLALLSNSRDWIAWAREHSIE